MDNTLFLETVDSTNSSARELAHQGKPHGFAVLAGCQTSGRGRLGKSWQSPAGMGLYATILLRPGLAIIDYSKITLTAGLAVSQVLEAICHLTIELKWPNDIYINGRKCGGILVETSSLQDEAEHFALVGIGLNINNTAETLSTELQKSATSLFLESGQHYDILNIFAAIRSRLLQLIAELAEVGFAGILKQWQRRDMLQGKWMQWLTPAGTIVYGKALGVDSNGMLSVQDNTGLIHEVLSGDITLVAGL